MNQINPTLIVYIDVDDTLIRSVGKKRIPMIKVIEHVKKLKADGAILYAWSSGGADYARSSMVELGIENCFEYFLPKPNLIIDDQLISEWKLCFEIHPMSLRHASQEEYWKEIVG